LAPLFSYRLLYRMIDFDMDSIRLISGWDLPRCPHADARS